MFKVLKLRNVIIVLIVAVVATCLGVGLTVSANNSPKPKYVIVVDAGHGGIDGGCVGSLTNTTESEINLKVAKYLEEKLKSNDIFKVVMTRTTSDGLYSQFSDNKKQDDMKKRKSIIEKAKPNMVVSIHMNSFPDSTEHGAQTFFQEGSADGQKLADAVQTQLVKNMYNAREFANHTDLYILKCVDSPSIVVEGGFLTNPDDEKLLVTDEYQEKLAYSIYCGIIRYLGCYDKD